MEITFPPLTPYRFLDGNMKEIDLKTMARPEAQVVVAPLPSQEHPGDLLMVNVSPPSTAHESSDFPPLAIPTPEE